MYCANETHKLQALPVQGVEDKNEETSQALE
jgi:hypothetical protein